MSSVKMRREISLTFRGFEVSPEDIEGLLRVKASEVGQRGSQVKPGVKSLLKRSFARFAVDLESQVRLDQAVAALLQHLGGVDEVERVRDVVKPEFLEVGITWSVKSSEDQEGGFITAAQMSDLARLRCDVTFEFL